MRVHSGDNKVWNGISMRDTRTAIKHSKQHVGASWMGSSLCHLYPLLLMLSDITEMCSLYVHQDEVQLLDAPHHAQEISLGEGVPAISSLATTTYYNTVALSTAGYWS